MALTNVVFPDPFGPDEPEYLPGSKGERYVIECTQTGKLDRDGRRFKWGHGAPEYRDSCRRGRVRAGRVVQAMILWRRYVGRRPPAKEMR